MMTIKTKNKRATRKDPQLRRTLILQSAIKLAKDIGYYNLTRLKVASRSKVSIALVSKYFNPFISLKKSVLQYAINFHILEIIAQGVTNRDPLTKKIDEKLKQEALNYLLNRQG